MRIYLVPGDVVFGGSEDHGFRCAYYGSAKGILVAGFLPAAKLHPISGQDDLSADFLIGKWQSSLGPHLTPNSITIVNGGPGKVNAAGEAYYQTAQTINDGSFGSAGVRVKQGAKEVVFRQGNGDIACAVTLRRRGPYLVVDDKGNCGGLNVTFRGIYVRLRGK